MKLVVAASRRAAITTTSSAHSEPIQLRHPAAAPDTIFLNGDIYTQATPPRAQAMAVRDGRIVAIGSNDDIRKLKGAHTQVVDLGGHFVMPGFNDAHVHLAAGGLATLEVDLIGVKSLAEMQQRIAEHARPWRRRLDRRRRLGPHALAGREAAHAPGHRSRSPAIIPQFFVVWTDTYRRRQHCRAEGGAECSRKTPDPPGGKIDRDAKRRAHRHRSREPRKDLILAKAPRPSLALRRRGIEMALANAARWGITSVQDNSDGKTF